MYYIIDDIEEFTESTRKLVFNSFGSDNIIKEEKDYIELMKTISSEDKKEMDQVITQQECLTIVKNIAKKQRNKTSHEIRFLITDKIFVDIVNAINTRLVSNLLGSLVQKGLIESAYDDNVNDFVFWVTDKENNNELPETD